MTSNMMGRVLSGWQFLLFNSRVIFFGRSVGIAASRDVVKHILAP